MGKVVDKQIDEQIHHGRREKLRASFQRYGLETFNETQVLEFSLGMVIPRIDTNPTAHRLINTFGSLDGVISAHPDKLKQIAGIGEQAANFLHFLKQFNIYMAGIERNEVSIKSPTDAVELLRGIMKLYPVEHFVVVCLDIKGNVLTHQNIRGDVDRVNINIRDVVDMCLRVNCYSVVFAHNHPDGTAKPSSADINLTKMLLGVLYQLNINVMDHIIFTDEKYYSFALNGLLDVLRRDYKSYISSTTQE